MAGVIRDISEIDENFKVESKLNIKGIKFFDIQNEPFKIYGVYKSDGIYVRMPKEKAANISEGVLSLYSNNAGGRIRFKTDSSYIAINAIYSEFYKRSHFSMLGSVGLDLYYKEGDGKENYKQSFVPPVDMEDGYESVVNFGFKRLRQISINMPTYATLKDLYIGLEEDSIIEYADDYKINKPIVYYGSSITQGGCASRPGNTYQSHITRRFDVDHINLGFSGRAYGEESMANYIKDIDMSVFVFDYDHNASGVEHLEKTHERFFKIIREANPELPIIIMSAPFIFQTLIGLHVKRLLKRPMIML